MKSKNNVSRKKIELLRQFRDCKTKQDFINFNNTVLLPLYEKTKEIEKTRCENQDFTEIFEDGFYLSDFNSLYDCQYFLENMSFDCQTEITHFYFVKNGWCVIN